MNKKELECRNYLIDQGYKIIRYKDQDMFVYPSDGHTETFMESHVLGYLVYVLHYPGVVYPSMAYSTEGVLDDYL